MAYMDEINREAACFTVAGRYLGLIVVFTTSAKSFSNSGPRACAFLLHRRACDTDACDSARLRARAGRGPIQFPIRAFPRCARSRSRLEFDRRPRLRPSLIATDNACRTRM